jgi:hypothetical protein
MVPLRSSRSGPRPRIEPIPTGPRAKALRPAELRADTRAALFAYERAARDHETMRTGEGVLLDTRELRRAAATVLDALVRELDKGTLPALLATDVDRWLDGEFGGTDIDVEVANHAIHALLGSETCAELEGLSP